MAAACDRMIATYEAGGSLPTMGDCRRLLVDTMRDLQLQGDETLIRQTATRLFDRMNNLLFRQQGLRWAAAACEALGLELQIYGNGWDKHPEFSNHARGSIGYGTDLEELTRSAAVNLVLEPFVCIAHQRVLDALAAGGFCLIRANPATAVLQSIIDLIATGGNEVTDSASLAATLDDPEAKIALQNTLADCAAIDPASIAIDQIANSRNLQRNGFLPDRGAILPLLDQVSFGSSDALQHALARFVRDESLRSDVARAQREAVESRYGYASGMRRVVQFIRARLESESVTRDRAA
jgi:hypothetical protein